MADDQPSLDLFARELQAVRARSGKSRETLAKEVNYSESLIAMVENGRRAPSAELALACDRVFGTPGTFERLQAHARAQAAVPEWFREWPGIECRAVTLKAYEWAVIPGLLQTPGYARAVIAGVGLDLTAEQIEENVRVRVQRQEILDRDDPPALWAVVEEGVLRREVAPADVMREQLDHLLEKAARPRISLFVLPITAGAHPGLKGAMTIAEFADGSTDIVYRESAAEDQMSDSPALARACSRVYAALMAEALPQKASLDLIADTRKRWN